MKKILLYIVATVIILSYKCTTHLNDTEYSQPSILVIVADDLGYADLGCYGSEIETTTLDSLASIGTLFTNFHTGSMCAPSRAMLLSSQDHHLAGWGRQRTVKGTWYEGKWGYENDFSNRVLSFVRLLQAEGYFTSMAGKWHLGDSDYSNPQHQGFDRSFALIQGAGNHWNDIGLGLSESDGEQSHFTENGMPVSYPNGQFSTTLYTNKTLEYLESKRKEQPFFALVSYTAPHWPLQPPDVYRDKYQGTYDEGYHVLRKTRFQELKAKKLIAEHHQLPKDLDHLTPWSSLSDEEQKYASRKMELYAGMVDHMDNDIERLLDGIHQMEENDNLIVIFLSDNGADYLDFYHNQKLGGFLRSVYNNSYENMGNPNSFISPGPEWAQASMAPFSWYKGYLAEGAIRAPLIISGKDLQSKGVVKEYLDIKDLAPTILDLAGIEFNTAFEGGSYSQMSGKSLANFLKGTSKAIHSDDEVYASDFQGKAFVRQGHFKILNQQDPTDESAFKLYDLSNDLGEQIDVSDRYPEIRQKLVLEWHKYRDQYNVVFPEDISTLNPYKENK